MKTLLQIVLVGMLAYTVSACVLTQDQTLTATKIAYASLSQEIDNEQELIGYSEDTLKLFAAIDEVQASVMDMLNSEVSKDRVLLVQMKARIAYDHAVVFYDNNEQLLSPEQKEKLQSLDKNVKVLDKQVTMWLESDGTRDYILDLLLNYMLVIALK